MKTTPLWSPPQGAANTSRMAQFMAEINAEFGANLQSFADLHGFSVRETEAFWSKAWDFLGVIGDKGGGRSSNWANGSKKRNSSKALASTMLKTCCARTMTTALIFWGEDKVKKTLTWAELHAAVSRAQQFLRAQGVREGDRVAALMPNKPEAVVGMLAASSLGAIWSCASPDFGVQGVLDRFGQIEPKVLYRLRRLLLSLQGAPDWRQGRRNHRANAERRVLR